MATAIALNLSCSPAQATFLNAPFPKLFAGGIGSGKTFAGVLQVLQMPNQTRGVVIAPTYPMLRDVILQSFLEIATNAIHSIDRSAMEIRLLGGRTVLLRSATHPDRLRGLNLDWVWIDEACFVSEDVFKVAIGRLRQSPTRWWLTTSPLRPSWVYDLFIAENAPLAGSVNVIHAKTDENPFISADYAEFLRRAYIGAWAERELDALWVDVRGQVFQREWIQYSDELSREHLVHRVMGIDLAVGMGEQHDFTAMVVVAHEPRYHKFQVDAAVRGKWTFAEQVEMAAQLCEQYQVQMVFAESTAYQPVFAQELARRGVPVTPIKTTIKKQFRIESLAPLYQMGIIKHAQKFTHLEAEMLSYPETPHDDLLDALWLALHGERQFQLLGGAARAKIAPRLVPRMQVGL
jgi:predicted phage terminase large subunit-like protein